MASDYFPHQVQLQSALQLLQPAEPTTFDEPDESGGRSGGGGVLAARAAAAPRQSTMAGVKSTMAGVTYSSGAVAGSSKLGSLGAVAGSSSATLPDERRLSALAAAGGSSGGSAGGAPSGSAASRVAVSSVDLLYLLAADPTTSRSRVLQWWRVNHSAVPQYAKTSIRLFGPTDDEAPA
jgi:hypothetical protein